mmetsp:Transcript_14639/g.44233  ORF Transcript_14639/g.44233 Transcript_14639/m.44233 type:complete len:297 (+) Transcript_14639:64-954(+)
MQDQLLARWQQWDALVSSAVFDSLKAVGFGSLSGPPSKITKDLPFADSPTPAVTTIGVYLVVVTLGAAFLRLRKQPTSKTPDPGWLRFLVQLHNVVLIVLSAGMAGSAIYWARQGRYNFWGNAYKPSETEMGLTIYVFYMSKFYEFFDTIIMLLKGKWQQISLLHVYHHASISFIWWAIVRVAPGGDAYYSCALNSFVHVLMYTYYLLSTMFGKDERLKRTYLWWGRYLTQFQMFQFVTNMGQACYCYYFSPYPSNISALLFFYMITLLVLFGNFYISKHGGKRQTGLPRNGKKTL